MLPLYQNEGRFACKKADQKTNAAGKREKTEARMRCGLFYIATWQFDNFEQRYNYLHEREATAAATHSTEQGS